MSFEEIAIPHSVIASIRAAKDAAITHSLLRGDSLFDAFSKAVNDLTRSAPKECDVLVEAFGVYVTEIGFIEPHAFLLHGYDDSGNNTAVVVHYSQLVGRVIYLPKRGAERVITGFWRDPKEAGKAGE